MKKAFSGFLAVLMLLLSLSGCAAVGDRELETIHVIYGWSGEFSKENRRETIARYDTEEGIPAELDGSKSISFEVDFEVKDASVSLLSKADKENIYDEMDRYVDRFVVMSKEGNRITINLDWWNAATTSHCLWSYLVRVVDTNDMVHYYYFRIDHSTLS